MRVESPCSHTAEYATQDLSTLYWCEYNCVQTHGAVVKDLFAWFLCFKGLRRGKSARRVILVLSHSFGVPGPNYIVFVMKQRGARSVFSVYFAKFLSSEVLWRFWMHYIALAFQHIVI